MMMMRSLLGSIAFAAFMAGAGFAEVAADNPLMVAEFFTDKTTVEQVQAELNKGAALDVRGRYGENPLHHAIEGHAPLAVIKLLIAGGAAVNQPVGKKGDLATLYAAYAGDLALMQTLKAAGADFTAVDDVKETALHWLTYNEHPTPEMLEFLIAEGIDPNAQSQSGDTAASQMGWSQAEDPEALYDLLLAKGSDGSGINADGQDLFMKAISYAGKGAWLERLYTESEDPAATDNNGLSGILLASQWGINKDRLEFLEAKGFDLQATTPKGENAMILNATYGDADSIKLLLDRGFDINVVDNKGNSPLLVALKNNAPENVTAIIAAGADVAHANEKGVTPIMLALSRTVGDPATEEGKPEAALFDLILAKGGDLKAVDAAGASTLIYAVKSGQPLVRIQQIIDVGVNVNAADGEGTTALMFAAIGAKDAAVITALVAAGADTSVRDVFDDNAAALAADNAALKGTAALAMLN